MFKENILQLLVPIVIGVVTLVVSNLNLFLKPLDPEGCKNEFDEKREYIRIELLKIIKKDEDIMHRNQLLDLLEKTTYEINHVVCIAEQINSKINGIKKSILFLGVWLIICPLILVFYSNIELLIGVGVLPLIGVALVIILIIIVNYRGYSKIQKIYSESRKNIEDKYNLIVLGPTREDTNERK